jgi:hypothetical protein
MILPFFVTFKRFVNDLFVFMVLREAPLLFQVIA